jgi:hypothetical protein
MKEFKLRQKIIRVAVSLLLCLSITAGTFVSFVKVDTRKVLADGQGQGQSQTTVKVGDTKVLANGCLTKCIGFADDKDETDANAIWQTTIGAPTYTTDGRLIDTTWILNQDGTYTAGANNFISTVETDGSVSVGNRTGGIGWNPTISLIDPTNKAIVSTAGNINASQIGGRGLSSLFTLGDFQSSNTPTLLVIDPLNHNYTDNTLQWDLGNGIKRYLRLLPNIEEEYYIVSQPLTDDLTISTNETNTGIFESPVTVYDSSRQPKRIPFKVDDDGNITIKLSDIVNIKAVYPIIIDPTITTSSNDGYLLYQSTSAPFTYSSVHDYATGSGSYSTPTNVVENYSYYNDDDNATEYVISRSFLYFNTSTLSGYNVISAYINLYMYGAQNVDNDSVQVQIGNPAATYPHSPMVAGDFNQSNYTGNGGSFIMSTYTVPAYYAVTLNSAGIGMINTTGNTNFCLRSKNDVNDITPTGFDLLSFYTYEQGAGYQPQLVVTYTTNVVPVVSTDSATSVTATSEKLSGTISSMGSYGSLNALFFYGTDPNMVTTTPTSPAQSMNTFGTFSFTVTGLTAGTTYYYESVTETGTSPVAYGNPQSFVAGQANIITNQASIVSSTSMALNGNLSSLNGFTYAICYFIWGQDTNYGYATPTHTLSTVTSYTDTVGTTQIPLIPGVIYHYKAVGVFTSSSNVQTTLTGSDITFSVGSQQLIPVTSQPYAPQGVTGATPSSNVGVVMQQPNTWWANGGSMSSLPFYQNFDTAATDLNPNNQNSSPHPTTMVLYLMAIMATAMAAGYGVLLFTNSSLLALGIMTIIMSVGASMTIISGWMVFLIIIGGIGIWLLAKYI